MNTIINTESYNILHNAAHTVDLAGHFLAPRLTDKIATSEKSTHALACQIYRFALHFDCLVGHKHISDLLDLILELEDIEPILASSYEAELLKESLGI